MQAPCHKCLLLSCLSPAWNPDNAHEIHLHLQAAGRFDYARADFTSSWSIDQCYFAGAPSGFAVVVVPVFELDPDWFWAAALCAREAKLPDSTLPPDFFASADWIRAAASEVIDFLAETLQSRAGTRQVFVISATGRVAGRRVRLSKAIFVIKGSLRHSKRLSR